ncbi:MAG TPA: hypothetical protein VE974_12620 [Thermoanaerobaculia bacterium]|nr:hypothetical protein [Thermoanaerobaculia bacterium]
MARRLIPILLLLTACTTTWKPVTEVEKEPHDSPDHAAAYHALKRGGTDDVFRAYSEAQQQMQRMQRYATASDASFQPGSAVSTSAETGTLPFRKWQFLGPGNVGGRTRALIIDPVEPQVMYAAGVSGGIWKTVSGGVRWEPIGDYLVNIAVNSMVMHPTDRNVLYAGTGEGYFREAERGTALPLRGNGIFMTRDAGASWTHLASTANNENFHYVNDLVISTHEPSRVYAATRTGVWRSVDAGATWSNIHPTTVKGGCLDLAYRGDTAGDYLFASCGTFAQATIYRNKNAELAPHPWEAVHTEVDMGRTSLAIAPSNPSVIYGMSATITPGPHIHSLHAVWRSDSNGDPGTWTARVRKDSTHDVVGPTMLTNIISIDHKICNGRDDEVPGTMGWYCNTLAVDPTNADRVFAGGVDIFRSDDGGSTWGLASYWFADDRSNLPYLHADQHVIRFHPQYDGVTNTTVFFGNDGGVARTDNALAKVPTGRDAICVDEQSEMLFQGLNGNYGVTQFYHGAVFPDGRQFIAGAQDNGTNVGNTDTGPDHWRMVVGGDGGYVAIDANSSLVYASQQWGRVLYAVGPDFRTRFNALTGGLEEGDFLFIAPFALDPQVARSLWMGGTSLWKTNSFNRWGRASAKVPDGAMISAIAAATSERVVAGTTAGDIIRNDQALSSDVNTVWASARPRAGFVSSLTFDPADSNVVYATYAGFGGSHVWRSTDFGATWTPIDGAGLGALPDIPVHSLAVDPTRRDRLYLGTDLGVFVSLDGGNTWSVENSGFAAVVTETVVIAQGVNGPAIYAFTHGRGAWRAELTVPAGRKRRGVRH